MSRTLALVTVQGSLQAQHLLYEGVGSTGERDLRYTAKNVQVRCKTNTWFLSLICGVGREEGLHAEGSQQGPFWQVDG